MPQHNKTNQFKAQINFQTKEQKLKNIHLEFNVKKIQLQDKTYHLIIIKDISNVVSMQKQILDLSKFSEAGIISSSLAHEINNPLGDLISYLQLLKMSHQKNSELLKDVSELLLSAEQCKKIATKLLSFSRKADLTKNKPLNAEQWMTSFLQGHKNKSLINYKASQKNYFISFNTESLELIFSELIKNSFEAFLPSKKEPKMEIVISKKNNSIVFTFTDYGPGMGNKIQSQALNPFFTTKSGKNNFGLGLTLSYHLVRQSSGQLNFYSKPNVGTSILLTFPRLDLGD